MRNAATFHDDIGFEEPARKAKRQSRSPAKRKKKSRRFGIDMTKVARYAAVGIGATLALGITVNALMLQKGRHPAPLFGKAIALAPAPTPVMRSARAASGGVPAPSLDETTATVQVPAANLRKAAPKAMPAKSADDDPIARLLKTKSPSSDTAHEDTKTVVAVQRALMKLGFVVKPDGTLGSATRKAIELFEKDRHLPVNGEVSRRLVKILSAESGVKID